MKINPHTTVVPFIVMVDSEECADIDAFDVRNHEQYNYYVIGESHSAEARRQLVKEHPPTFFLAHLERVREEKDRRLVKAYDVEDDGTLKKFSHKKDFSKDLYYNVLCGDVADMSLKLPKKDYSLFIADIPYGFRMAS